MEEQSAQAYPATDQLMVEWPTVGATVLQAHDIGTKHGSFAQAGRDITIENHYHSHQESTVNLNILDVFRLVPNLRKIHLDILSKATAGTGIWFLRTKSFLLWLDPNGNLKILWGTGIPGAGKSIMASIIINHLEAIAAAAAAATGGGACVAYVYFRYSDATDLTLKRVLEILVKQTVERHSDCALLAEQLYARHLRERTQPTEAELLVLLGRFTKTKKITLYVLDALDEAPDRLQVVLLKKLVSLNVRLFITSRPLKSVESLVPDTCSFKFPITAQEGDLDLHIEDEITNSRDLQDLLKEEEPAFRDEMIAAIKKNCGGMFLHASLQLDAISRCTSTQDVIETLERFPSDIETVYQKTWDRICRQTPKNTMLAKAVVTWVLIAARSLTIDELRYAVATSSDTRKFERKRLVPAATLLTLCCGLVVMEEETKLVRLVHYTAKNTLAELLREDFPHPHSLLAAVCMKHLAECGFQDTTITEEEEYIAALHDDPLLTYASHAWATHARESLNIPEIHRQTAEFISNCRAFPSFIGPDRTYEWDIIGPLHILALHHLPLDLLHGGNIRDLNVVTKIVRESPLKLGSWHGNDGIVRDLLRYPDTQVNYIDKDGTSALMQAAEQGHGCSVDMLLARPEIQVNIIDAFGRAALVSAALNGHEAIVTALLTRHDIQVNLSNSHGWSALISAITNGHEGTVKLLLEHPDINVNLANSVDGSGWTPLMEAANKGHEAIVKLLLEHPEIEFNLVDMKGESALLKAARQGRENIVKLFLARAEVQVNTLNKHGWSTLISAIANDQEGTVELLLEHPDTDVNLANNVDVNGSGWTALMEATNTGREGITKLLLKHPKIEINLVSKEGWSALVLAAWKGYTSIVELLLAHSDIQVNAVDNEGWSALIWASNQGHIGIIKLLLACPNIQVNLVNHSGWSALRFAATRGLEGVVELLAHPGIQVNTADNKGSSPLMEAAHWGADDSVSALLEHPDIDINAVNNSGRSALMLAALRGHEGVVRLLLTHPDVRIDSIDNEGCSALMLAENAGHEGCVALLTIFINTQVHNPQPRSALTSEEEPPEDSASEGSDTEFYDAEGPLDTDDNY